MRSLNKDYINVLTVTVLLYKNISDDLASSLLYLLILLYNRLMTRPGETPREPSDKDTVDEAFSGIVTALGLVAECSPSLEETTQDEYYRLTKHSLCGNCSFYRHGESGILYNAIKLSMVLNRYLLGQEIEGRLLVFDYGFMDDEQYKILKDELVSDDEGLIIELETDQLTTDTKLANMKRTYVYVSDRLQEEQFQDVEFLEFLDEAAKGTFIDPSADISGTDILMEYLAALTTEIETLASWFNSNSEKNCGGPTGVKTNSGYTAYICGHVDAVDNTPKLYGWTEAQSESDD